MGTMMGCIRVDGDNTYKIDHFKKSQQRRAGTLPVSFTCPPELVIKGRKYLESAGNEDDPTSASVLGEDVNDTVDENILDQQLPEDTATTGTTIMHSL